MAGGVLRWLCARRRWRRSARLVLWGVEEARAAEPGTAAGEIMMEHAGRVVCRADAFLVGRPAPVLAVDDALEAGRTYLVMPADRVPGAAAHDGVVTAASLAALSHGGGRSPFKYGKDEDGRTVVRVAEEFVVRAVAGDGGSRDGGGCGAPLCSTPELRKHYEQLVGAARGRPWSPRLDTIKERSGGRRRLAVVVSPGRLSPVRLLTGMDKGFR